MEKNVGKLDQVLRIVIGIVLLLLGLFFTGGWFAKVLIILGFIGLITGILAKCPLYAVFKINTCKVKEEKEEKKAE